MMTKIKEGYKETEIGIIPEDWKVVNFGEVSKVSQGLQIAISKRFKEDGENRLPYITIQFINKPNEKNNQYFVENANTTVICKPDDVLMTRTGNTGIVVTNQLGVFHNNFFKIDFNRELIDKNFLVYYLNSIRKLVLSYAGASTIPDLNHGSFYKIPLVLPEIEEQKHIAEILSRTDEHIEKLDKTIEDYELLEKGMMQKLLTEGMRHTEFKDSEIGRIPKDWEVVRLEKVSNIIAGQSPSSDSYNKEAEGLPFYQGKTDFGDLYPTRTVWCSSPKKVAEEGDILISVRAPVGDVNICQEPSCIGRGLGAIRVNDSMDNMFVYYYIQQHQRQLNRVAQGSTFLAINTGDLKGFIIAKPSVDEQREIGRIIYNIDENISKLKNTKLDYETLKGVLADKLLTGKVRVI